MALPPPVQLLIIGGGLTGSLLASLLPPALAASAALWEKSTNAGRFATAVARGSGAPALADLGAQYLTAFDEPSAAALAEAHAAGVLARVPPGAVPHKRQPGLAFRSCDKFNNR